jgi:16S rRNA (adenine1518-N6/adenine1519-N6)-dimethyltransferase
MIAKKFFGQNFLSDKNIIRKIVATAEVKPGDLILEIGPGQGNLTEVLLEAGAKVVVVEVDRDLIEPLKEKFDNKIKLIFGDILATSTWNMIRDIVVGASGRSSLRNYHEPYSVVANIPYNITSPILETLFRANPRPSRLTLMVQREVADRILATPPNTSVLSIACQLYATGRKVLSVSRGAFRPVPKVDSVVIRLDLRREFVGGADPEEVLKIVKFGFATRRKILAGNLARAKVCSLDQAKIILENMGLTDKARAENLSPEQWVELYQKIIHT